MVNLQLKVVPNKVLRSGKHKIRLVITHNGDTRYIPTDIVIDSINEFKNGRVVNRSDKDMLNIRLKKIFNIYQERCDSLEYPHALNCMQLVEMIKTPIGKRKYLKFTEIADEYTSQIDEKKRKGTNQLYKLAVKQFTGYAGDKILMEQITPITINGFIKHMRESNLSSTTIRIYAILVKVIINYAKKLNYVKYDVDPFITAQIPSAKKRDTSITVEQLKAIRDMEVTTHGEMVTRDIFLLTYYLAGMNLIDMLSIDFRSDEVSYMRKKTSHTKEDNTITCFSIPDEAKPIIKKYMKKSTGKLIFGKYKDYSAYTNLLNRTLKKLKQSAGINHPFTLYSARKSFVQHGYDLDIQLSTLEYCIGQTMKEDRPIFNYLVIMKNHAVVARRKILDNLL